MQTYLCILSLRIPQEELEETAGDNGERMPGLLLIALPSAIHYDTTSDEKIERLIILPVQLSHKECNWGPHSYTIG